MMATTEPAIAVISAAMIAAWAWSKMHLLGARQGTNTIREGAVVARILMGMFLWLAFSQPYQNILRLRSCEPPAASCIYIPSALR